MKADRVEKPEVLVDPLFLELQTQLRLAFQLCLRKSRVDTVKWAIPHRDCTSLYTHLYSLGMPVFYRHCIHHPSFGIALPAYTDCQCMEYRSSN